MKSHFILIHPSQAVNMKLYTLNDSNPKPEFINEIYILPQCIFTDYIEIFLYINKHLISVIDL